MIVCDFSGESCEEEQPNQVQLVRHILSEVHHVVQGEPPSLSFACATLRYLDSSYSITRLRVERNHSLVMSLQCVSKNWTVHDPVTFSNNSKNLVQYQ